MMLKMENEVRVTVRCGETNEVRYDSTQFNDISDDFTVSQGAIFIGNNLYSAAEPFCFILPDDSGSPPTTEWTDWTNAGGFIRNNPWAPFCMTGNNYDHTDTIVNASADLYYKTRATINTPYSAGNATNKWKLFYRWAALGTDFQFKACGLTAWNLSYGDQVYGANPSNTIFKPMTLVVLPTSITVRGLVDGNDNPQTADVLEISYFLSIVGA